MTSYREPDYDLALSVSLEDFHAIAGKAFDITITIGDNQNGVPGMMIIPEGNDFPVESSTAEAWLWIECEHEHSASTKIAATLGEVCDPMFLPEGRSALDRHQGLVLEGEIQRNRNADAGVDGNL